jgi:hypothetical protein
MERAAEALHTTEIEGGYFTPVLDCIYGYLIRGVILRFLRGSISKDDTRTSASTFCRTYMVERMPIAPGLFNWTAG